MAILNFQDSSLWQSVYQIELVAADGIKPGIYTPIPRHTVPGNFDSPVIIIGTSSSTAKPTWRLGCYLNVLGTINGVGNTEFYSDSCPFGLKLFKLPEFTDSYQLKLIIPRWHQRLDIAIWKYLGNFNDI